ncbi:MAG: hypothetical protein H7233_12530 [Pseudorhodobacter sp.]|nr:hypothetical protein [Frankiaceae bacterium]
MRLPRCSRVDLPVGEDPPVREDVGELVTRMSAQDASSAERRSVLLSLVRVLGSGARAAGGRAVLSGRWLADTVVDDVAPRLPVRDLLTLREHHGGLSGDDLAASLIAAAATVTAAIGAAAGALAAVELAAPPTLLAAPVQLAAETLAVTAVELKLVAELHVAAGRAPLGTRAQLATAYVSSWATKKAVDGRGPGLASVLTGAARSQVRSRLVRRLGTSVTTLAPFLAGAIAGAELNRRQTRSLGEALAKDLRRR